MRILVCGGRDFNDRHKFLDTMEDILRPWRYNENTYVIISGGAKGADSLAIEYAKVCGHKLEVYYADWKKYPKAAGPIRNQQMLDEGQPDLVVAFPGGRGTADMVRRATKAGVKVILIEKDN